MQQEFNKVLTKINEGKVKSDRGFSIHITGLESLKYEDHECSIEIEWNYDPKVNKTYIYASDIMELNETKKKQVIKNIEEAVQLLKGDFEVV